MKIKDVASYYGMTEFQYNEYKRMLPYVRRALLKNAIYAKVESVSRSGMSRKVSLYIVVKGEIYCLNYAFGKIFGDKYDKNTGEVTIGGCGMDMLFEANYRLFRTLLPKKEYQSYCRYKSM